YMVLLTIALGVLVLTASRASYIAFLASIILYLVYVRKFKVLLFVLITTALLTPLSDNLSNRLTRTFQQTKVFVDSDTGNAFVARKLQPDDLPPGDYGAVNQFGAPTTQKDAVKLKPEEEAAARKQIRDAFIDQANTAGKAYSAEEINSAVDAIFMRQIPITKYLPDISISTRMQSSWPRALNAFLKNIWLGSGPSSLGEATDGDYLRWLGEVGIIGTGLFLAIFSAIAWPIWQAARTMAPKKSYLFHAFIFAFMGLFINASYIDIFEASKLAYTFWLVAGIFYAAYPLFQTKLKTHKLKL
ncbi:O-antigen ligase family protein, partial [Candidatus Woesebacteria bacterium]|nr:O-antigen ligase family protein [Candidatus Woesebacteria bacterium]